MESNKSRPSTRDSLVRLVSLSRVLFLSAFRLLLTTLAARYRTTFVTSLAVKRKCGARSVVDFDQYISRHREESMPRIC